jgi:anti-sigma factor RsiW
MGPAAGEHPEDLGAHALDALGPAEAAAVRAHTAHCRDCRQQLDEFAEVKDLLDRVPLEALLDSSPDGGKLLL